VGLERRTGNWGESGVNAKGGRRPHGISYSNLGVKKKKENTCERKKKIEFLLTTRRESGGK